MANSIIFSFEGFCARCIITILKYLSIQLLIKGHKNESRTILPMHRRWRMLCEHLVAAPKSRMTECG
jgi:hypothetical protein